MEVQLKTTKSKLNLSFHVLIFQIWNAIIPFQKNIGPVWALWGPKVFGAENHENFLQVDAVQEDLEICWKIIELANLRSP